MNWRDRLALVAILATGCLGGWRAAAADSRTFALFSPEQVSQISAQRAPEEAGLIVTLAAFYEKHGRSSNAKATIHLSGTLSATPDFESAKDFGAMLAMALAYRFTDDSRYLHRLTMFFDEWLAAYNLSRAPILQTEDCLELYPVPDPGVRCLDPIDDRRVMPMIVAYDIVQLELPPTTRRMMRQFMGNMAQSYLHDFALRKTSKAPRAIENARTNWQAYRVALATLSAYQTGKRQYIQKAQKAFNEFVEQNMVFPLVVVQPNGTRKKVIVNDGSVFDFHQRDALHYVVFDLEPLLIAVLAAKAHGDDWYSYVSPKKASVKRALEWLVPYATGEKTHQEFVKSTIPFDKQRAQAGWKGFSGTWDPQTSKLLFRMAAQLDEGFDMPELRKITAGTFPPLEYDPKRTHDPGIPMLGFLFR